MFHIKTIALLAVLTDTAAGSHSPAKIHIENPSHPSFFSYVPTTDVCDHAAIDMDQKEIVTQLVKNTLDGFLAAKRIYTLGGHSRPYASITLEEPVDENIKDGSMIRGFSQRGDEISGTVLGGVNEGENVLWFLYETVPTLGAHADCQVGGSTKQLMDGCLEEDGWVELPGMSLNYTYDPMLDNRNARRFGKFSEEAEFKMYQCDNCPYEDFEKFYEYYGKFDYADEWIRSAFDGFETDFRYGNADFSTLPREGRAEAVRTGTAFMSLWMYIIREMEYALDWCTDGCDGDDDSEDCNGDDHAWDQAVAFYTGALEQDDDGFLLYSLSNSLCKRFGTCGPNGDKSSGDAYVNLEIFKQFNEGQQNLRKGRCFEARQNKEAIVKLMAVPLVQSTILHVHSQTYRDDKSPKKIAQGASFAATVLPVVHACSPEDAMLIYNDMRIGEAKDSEPDFLRVKHAFERNYECMGITCEDVGGILAKNSNGYQRDSAPCVNGKIPQYRGDGDSKRGSGKAGAAVGITIAVLAALGIIAFAYHRFLGSQIEFTGNAADEAVIPQNATVIDLAGTASRPIDAETASAVVVS